MDDDLLDVSACACRALRQASRVVTQAYDEALRPTGLRATQFTMLAALNRLGDQSITDLAEALVLDRTTLTRNLQPMVKKGIVFSRGDEDGRVRVVGLSGKGGQLVNDALPHWRNAQANLVNRVGHDSWVSLAAGLRQTVDAMRSQ